MKLMIFILLGIIAWLVNRLIFITRAYRDDLNDLRYQLSRLQQPQKEQKAPTPEASITELIDINLASKTRLQSLPGVGAVSAQRIIDARPIENIEALGRVEGIKPDLLGRLNGKVCF